MPKGIPNKRYTGEFKQKVIETMHKEKLSFRETARQFEISDHTRVLLWERIYLEEGPEGLYIERRGRKNTGRPRKLPKEVEEDLLAEQLNLICRVRMKKYKSYKGEVGKIAPNLLERDFVASKPNEKWVTDVTEFSLFDQKLYLSPILDLYSGDIVSYTISEHPKLSIVTEMLDKAFEKIPDDTNLILHSDQGWHYQHKQYQKMLIDKGIQQSMSRKGNCLDNAVIENFFGLLKTELLYLQEFDSLEHFRAELEEYLDYYNNCRTKLKLNGLTPAIHRSQAFLAA